MSNFLIDYGTLAAFAMLSIGIILQIRKLKYRKSAEDIAAWELALRVLASTLILARLILTKDIYLILGQTIFTLIYIVYVFKVCKYKKRSGNRLTSQLPHVAAFFWVQKSGQITAVYAVGFPHSEIPGSQVATHLPEAYRRYATSFIAV